MNTTPLNERTLLLTLPETNNLTEGEQDRIHIIKFVYKNHSSHFSCDVFFEYCLDEKRKIPLKFEMIGNPNDDELWRHILYEDSTKELEFPSFRKALNYFSPNRNSKKTNEWICDFETESLAQAYYYFEDAEGESWCIYLRWWHFDPWRVALIHCDSEWYFDFNHPETIDELFEGMGHAPGTPGYYTKEEYPALMERVLEIVKKECKCKIPQHLNIPKSE